MDALQRHRAAVRSRLLSSGYQRPGPESVSWTVNREAVVIAGWGRAILLQLAHPSIAAGIDAHSNFRGGLMPSVRRLYSTVAAMLALTFGDTEEVVTAAAGINVIHDRVRGRAGGLRYSAHDPGLQKWVHATLLDSIPLTYERLVGPLTGQERDRYCREAAIMEPLLGMPEGSLPRDAAQLDRYMHGMLAGGQLVVNATSRALARAVLYPSRWYVLWPAFRVIQLMTIASLPPVLREGYGFTWTRRDERALARWLACTRLVRRLLPPWAREWPAARARRALGRAALLGEVYVPPQVEGGA